MIRIYTIVLLLFSSVCASAQSGLYNTKQSEFSFYSKAPLEDIEAKNTRATSILNTTNNEMVVIVPIAKFVFPNKLMQQHFNENYMESEKYPHATFKGKMNEEIDFSKPGVYDVSATGVLNIHGVNRERTIKGKLTVSDKLFSLVTSFDVMLSDHNIDIPKLVFNKIAEKIAVSAKINYTPYSK
jgi:polyisoprenoid-binding protein YceI